jgi:SAM-dependent methyltransferase
MRSSATHISNKTMAILEVEIGWESEVARHKEAYYVPLNVWRELDLLPAALARGLMGQLAGTRIEERYNPGDLLPLYDQSKSNKLGVANFIPKPRVPRLGRFYPKAFLTGFAGNPLPFRCIDVNSRQFVADFNHPLAGRPLSLTIRVQALASKRSEKGGACQDWLDLILGSGPGMQARWPHTPTDFFANHPFARDDEADDLNFYDQPRLVSHIDAQAMETIQDLYARLLSPGLQVLDLMSSWQSHLPDSLTLTSLVGLGMNEAELQHNPRLTGYVVHNLNQDPRLPFADKEFDAVICNLSVEYLTKPQALFQEAARILRPGGRFIQTFSTRWFPPKVIRIWPELHEFERLGLVLEYFLRSECFVNLATFSSRGWPRPATDRYFPQVRLSDPVYAVWGEVLG